MTYSRRLILTIQIIACPAMPWLTLALYCLALPCLALSVPAVHCPALPWYCLFWSCHINTTDFTLSDLTTHSNFFYILRSYSAVRVFPSAFSISSFSAVQYSTVPCRVISCCVMRCHVVLCIRSDLDITFCDHLTVSRSVIKCRDFFSTLDNLFKNYFFLFLYLFIISCSFSHSPTHSLSLYHSPSFSRAHTNSAQPLLQLAQFN